MASAESGRGAILSTHKHGQQLRELFTLCKETKKKPALAFKFELVPTAIVFESRPLTRHHCLTRSTVLATPKLRHRLSLARETRMAQKG
ncbi:hypothetical protein I79_004317 [Cricetulus griseus]|uniref:Uncharacterized protein n=1 Tax=Cricetulus griseus TaxID=10029 RepID=G3H271_CRIGR|nr:hypothetical protein I79_004317 [Cricetulus griseus]